MGEMIYIGIDNGVTGSLAIIGETGQVYYFEKIPVFIQQSYTKTKQNITRIDIKKLSEILDTPLNVRKCIIERPMVNPGRFKATVSAIRALEAVIIILENLKIPFEYIDSKEWQKALLPKNMGKIITTKNGKQKRKIEPSELKKASLDIGKRLFPSVNFKGFNDADGLLIAEYLRRKEK